MEAATAAATDAASEVDIAATRPTKVVKVAASLVALTGLFETFAGLQTLASVTFVADWAGVVPYLQMGLGVALLFVAAHLHRARYWAATAAAGLTTFAFLGTTAWEVLTIVWGLFSCLGVLTIPLAMGAMVCSFLALRPCRRAEDVRDRLHEDGLDLGF